MNAFNITAEEMQALSAYIDEGIRGELTEAAIGKVFYAEGQIRARLAKECASLRAKLDRANTRVERFEEARKEKILQGDFAETGLDSVDVALCLLYYLQQTKTYKLSKAKLQYILFEVYAAWLAGHKERLFIEKPVCTEYGPQFWRVYKKVESLANPVGFEAVNRVASQNAGIAAICKNAAAKYYDYSEAQLKAYLVKCDAYKAALPEKNGGKWNGELDDRLILRWKENQSK